MSIRTATKKRKLSSKPQSHIKDKMGVNALKHMPIKNELNINMAGNTMQAQAHCDFCYVCAEEESRQLDFKRSKTAKSIYGCAKCGRTFHMNQLAALHFQIGLNRSGGLLQSLCWVSRLYCCPMGSMKAWSDASRWDSSSFFERHPFWNE